jgi:Domain of unknown function DUF1829/Domain of unknown function DUF1828
MECQQVITDYLKWIKDNTIVKTVEEGKVCLISTPFLDRHNDHLDIYLIKNNGALKLSDNGYTIADLKMSGFEMNTPKRESILRTALNGFGVKINGNDELYVETNTNNVGQKKHYLLQAILAVNDMFNLSQETVHSLFKEDVELYFRSNDIFFSKDIKLSGKSGFDHNVDFLIPATKNKPERLIKAINSAKKDTVLSSIMAFNDINQTRETETTNFVLYNDIEKEVSNDIISALENYNVKHIPWSKKEQCLSEFSLN